MPLYPHPHGSITKPWRIGLLLESEQDIHRPRRLYAKFRMTFRAVMLMGFAGWCRSLRYSFSEKGATSASMFIACQPCTWKGIAISWCQCGSLGDFSEIKAGRTQPEL